MSPTRSATCSVGATPSFPWTADAAATSNLLSNPLGGVVGYDYPRPFALPGNRVLVLMQDAFIARAGTTPATLAEADFAHNAAVLVDEHACVTTLSAPHGFLDNGDTEPLSHWFWPLGGGMGADGHLHVFAAEFTNSNGTGAAMGAHPIATWEATIDIDSLTVQSFKPATNASASLYGWSVTSDANYSYLYAHCYRQFIPGTLLGHDACAKDITVARVPRGQFNAPYEYFDGNGWSSNPADASPLVFSGRRTVNPATITYVNGLFVSVSKEGDWWGDRIYVDTATEPTGPWLQYEVLQPEPKCTECNTYFATLLPAEESAVTLEILLSNNAWDMQHVAFADPAIYRPTALTLQAPTTATRSVSWISPMRLMPRIITPVRL